MKKFSRYLLGSVAIIVCVLIIALFFFKSQLPDMISRDLSKKFKVPVVIGNFSFSLDTIEVDGVEIGNIPNSYLSKAFSVKTVQSKASLFNYFKETIHIEQISLDNIYLGLEFDSPKGTQGNWTILMGNLESSTSSASSSDSKTVIIDELVLTNIQVDVVYRSSGGSVKRLKPIPKIVLRNINSSQGLPTEQIMQSVLGQMLKSVFINENLKNMFEGLLDQPKGAVDNLLQPFKGLF